MVWTCRPNILLSVFLISLALPACFTNLYNDILDYALNASDVIVVLTIRSISVPNQNIRSSRECYLKGGAFLPLRKENHPFYQKA